jgi:hypothetical protein
VIDGMDLRAMIAMGRQPHHPPLAERFADTPPAPENPTPVEAMAHRLPAATRQALTALMTRLIFDHAAGDHRPQPREARHDV